jgi:hypothetical protein
MKNILTLFASLFAFSCFAQNESSGSYNDLMKQSRRARTTSIILVSAGPVVAVGGVGTLIYGLLENEVDDSDPIYDQYGNFLGYDTKKHTTEIVVGAAATLVGIGIALSSIHFSHKANDLKREARKVKLKTSSDHFIIPGFQNSFGKTGITQYKLSLLIPLGK